MMTGNKTYMVCSKFSPVSMRTLDSLKQINISLEPHISVIWIDNPKVRNMVLSTSIKTVPCIIKLHDGTTTAIEGEQFMNYINTFIQTQRQEALKGLSSMQQAQIQAQQHQAHLSGQQVQYPLNEQQHIQQQLQQQQAQLQQAQHQAQLLAQQQQMQQQQHVQQQQAQQQQAQQQQAQQQHQMQQLQMEQAVQEQPRAPQPRPPKQRQKELVEIEEGTTSLSSILGDILEEKSLYDYHEEKAKRPLGTESRDSDHSDMALQTSKRNSINQRVRAMSSDRVVPLPQKEKETFELEEIDEGEEMPMPQQQMPERESGLTMIPEIKDKKKTNAVMDRAKEMAKLREL